MKKILKSNKGQAMIDALMLILSISIVFAVVNLLINPNAMKAEQLRYENQMHQRTLLTLFNTWINNGTIKGKAIDLLAVQTCNGCPSNLCESLNASLNETLKKTNKGKNYIFFTSGGIYLYDKQATACLDDIVVSNFKYETICGELNIIYGSWPDYLNVPEVC